MQPLYEAVRAGNREAARVAVASDPSLAIFAAAIFGDAAEIETLLAGNRTLVSSLSSDGWTPLHLASHFGQEAAVRALLNRGAEVNACSTNALANTPLHAAAAGRAAGVAKILLDHGASANARQNAGWTPLHAAAMNGDIPLARILLDAGADVTVRADNQQTSLDLALMKGHQSMVELLEASGTKQA